MSTTTQVASKAHAERRGSQTEAMLDHYLRAVHEVFLLRRALAYESSVTEEHLAAPSLRPTHVRQSMERQVRRMTWAAQGGAAAAYDTVSPQELRTAMHEAAMPSTLTRNQWENPLSLDNGPLTDVWAAGR